ncbi:hypothetical protein MUN76_12000 [Leucobacter rhizosphaerae]|uniref:Gram-positive cocci surface proteins LPxTG domain-containing protein n=1 Tax=Leucobacter rhizosphaerae TaxID=2932245 RepID=A0ABY4FTY0_9MICO|nr:hypothetical protein [Leucobacter rhizosphaerae]UOQ59763.1 hypothetical protein MUN76_12000 [Leucobacter rhizosphaerae]
MTVESGATITFPATCAPTTPATPTTGTSAPVVAGTAGGHGVGLAVTGGPASVLPLAAGVLLVGAGGAGILYAIERRRVNA